MLLAGVDLSDETLVALVALLRADHYGHVADKLDDRWRPTSPTSA
jgi:hypothetical protein